MDASMRLFRSGRRAAAAAMKKAPVTYFCLEQYSWLMYLNLLATNSTSSDIKPPGENTADENAPSHFSISVSVMEPEFSRNTFSKPLII